MTKRKEKSLSMEKVSLHQLCSDEANLRFVLRPEIFVDATERNTKNQKFHKENFIEPNVTASVYGKFHWKSSSFRLSRESSLQDFLASGRRSFVLWCVGENKEELIVTKSTRKTISFLPTLSQSKEKTNFARWVADVRRHLGACGRSFSETNECHRSQRRAFIHLVLFICVALTVLRNTNLRLLLAVSFGQKNSFWWQILINRRNFSNFFCFPKTFKENRFHREEEKSLDDSEF